MHSTAHRPLVIILLLLIGTATYSADDSYYETLLKSHGVRTSVPEIAVFLENGWYGTNPPNRLPDEPAFKSSLLIDAWRLLAYRYDLFLAASEETRRAVANTALLYAEKRFPAGVGEIVEEDMRRLNPSERATERQMRIEALQFNGVVAAGWFCEATDASRRVLARLLAAENRPIIQVNYLKSLALLGDPAAIDGLVAEAAKANRDSSVMAADTLTLLTGQTFDLTANRAVEPRAKAAQDIIRWRMRNPGPLALDRVRIVVRQLRPSAPPPRPDLRSIRGMLRACADKLDVTDERGSRTAWTQLNGMGKSLTKHLDPVLDDTREDLDIRSEAIRWLVRVEGKNSRKRLKQLTHDPNPEIAETARQFLDTEPWNR